MVRTPPENRYIVPYGTFPLARTNINNLLELRYIQNETVEKL